MDRKTTKSTRASEPTRSAKPGTERARDEQRRGGGPRYGGGPWEVADERGESRFGHARNDDAVRSELAPRDAENDDDESVNAADPELAQTEQTERSPEAQDPEAPETRSEGSAEDDPLGGRMKQGLRTGAQATGEIESGGQRAGMRRGEKPRKPKSRER